jgi:hypothetical protein
VRVAAAPTFVAGFGTFWDHQKVSSLGCVLNALSCAKLPNVRAQRRDEKRRKKEKKKKGRESRQIDGYI